MPGRRDIQAGDDHAKARPGGRWLRSAAGLGRALFEPDLAFAGPGAEAIPRLPLVLLLFAFAVAGARLSSMATLTPEASVLAMNEVDAQIGSLMAAAPTEARDRAREQMLDALVGGSSGIAAAFSIVLAGAGFVLVLGELWLACQVITQFFGGQEERRGRSRASIPLVLVAGVPLAVRRFLAGLLLATRGPGPALNSLTIEEYRRGSTVRFDLASLAGASGLPAIPATLLRLLSDPFVLWALAILVLGGRQVYRLPLRAAAGQVAVLVALLALQSWLLGRLGIAWEL